jgi:hypothetical protein
MPVPAIVATNHKGSFPPSSTAITSLMLNLVYPKLAFGINGLLDFQLVKEVAGKQNSQNENEKQAQIKRRAV